jgi:hypothetical protein
MATFSMATRGPGSPLVPTLDLVPIGPKVKRPVVKFHAPGEDWFREYVEADESPEEGFATYLPEAEEIIDALPPAAQEAFSEDLSKLENPTDQAIVDLAYRYAVDALTEKLRGWEPEQLPTKQPTSKSVYTDTTEASTRGFGPMLGLAPPPALGGAPAQDIRWR